MSAKRTMRQAIHLDSLRLPVQVGIHAFEKAAPQPYEICVWLFLKPGYWCNKDALSETVDYDALRARIVEHLGSRAFNLQETIAQDILSIAFDLDLRIVCVRVTVTKPAVYEDCKGVGLDYELSREEWAEAPTKSRTSCA